MRTDSEVHSVRQQGGAFTEMELMLKETDIRTDTALFSCHKMPFHEDTGPSALTHAHTHTHRANTYTRARTQTYAHARAHAHAHRYTNA